jgi:hypothetical protein
VPGHTKILECFLKKWHFLVNGDGWRSYSLKLIWNMSSNVNL